jgi:hypothetical protein
MDRSIKVLAWQIYICVSLCFNIEWNESILVIQILWMHIVGTDLLNWSLFYLQLDKSHPCDILVLLISLVVVHLRVEHPAREIKQVSPFVRAPNKYLGYTSSLRSPL